MLLKGRVLSLIKTLFLNHDWTRYIPYRGQLVPYAIFGIVFRLQILELQGINKQLVTSLSHFNINFVTLFALNRGAGNHLLLNIDIIDILSQDGRFFLLETEVLKFINSSDVTQK